MQILFALLILISLTTLMFPAQSPKSLVEEVFQEYMKDANFYRNQSDARLKQIRMAMNIVACTEKDPEILSMIKLFAEEAQTEITERRSNSCINLVEA